MPPDKSRLTQLGHATALPASPAAAVIEKVENTQGDANYVVRFTVPEFTSICPVTGQPDSAHLEIYYIPDATCIETKSLKFYLASYRNHAAFNEAIVNRVLDDIVKACAPKQVVVRGKFGARGGIQLTCEARFPDIDETLRLPE